MQSFQALVILKDMQPSQKIWKAPISLELIAMRNQDTMVTYLGIEFLEVGPDFLKARMPVDHRTLQPYGIMHGGASCVLAETAASVAASYCVDLLIHSIVGIEINTSHIRSISSGWVFGTAKPLHLGSSTQLWEIPITDDQGRLVSMSRLRMAILDQRKAPKV